MVQNKALIFKKVPEGYPKVGEHLAVETREFDLDQNLPSGGIITKNHYISFDPVSKHYATNCLINSPD